MHLCTHACVQQAVREEVRLDATNNSSGANNARPAGNKAWNGDRETNRSGREYRQQERSTGFYHSQVPFMRPVLEPCRLITLQHNQPPPRLMSTWSRGASD